MTFFCHQAHWVVTSHVFHALDGSCYVLSTQLRKEHVRGPRRKNVVTPISMKI